ncbi:hypothetical protein JRQ81_012210 [Phrynocephalus forsythii]|uniref:Uncharacterized protein n=1 Tax=Phrynocephalus forsythii TaxID=171643 RepID=A0A9Q1APU5_9SAUR|nr:hypothetical protein JRQ81_012210 [Phrynocephalus forsythii]
MAAEEVVSCFDFEPEATTEQRAKLEEQDLAASDSGRRAGKTPGPIEASQEGFAPACVKQEPEGGRQGCWEAQWQRFLKPLWPYRETAADSTKMASSDPSAWPPFREDEEEEDDAEIPALVVEKRAYWKEKNPSVKTKGFDWILPVKIQHFVSQNHNKGESSENQHRIDTIDEEIDMALEPFKEESDGEGSSDSWQRVILGEIKQEEEEDDDRDAAALEESGSRDWPVAGASLEEEEVISVALGACSTALYALGEEMAAEDAGGVPALGFQIQAELEKGMKEEQMHPTGLKTGPSSPASDWAGETERREGPSQPEEMKPEPEERLKQCWEAQWQHFLKDMESSQLEGGSSQLLPSLGRAGAFLPHLGQSEHSRGKKLAHFLSGTDLSLQREKAWERCSFVPFHGIKGGLRRPQNPLGLFIHSAQGYSHLTAGGFLGSLVEESPPSPFAIPPPLKKELKISPG